MKVQGSQLYFVDPTGNTLVEVDCPTQMALGGGEVDQIETTCLGSDQRTYQPGLRGQNTFTFTINADLSKSSHARLAELYGTGDVVHWAIGVGKPKTDPTVDGTGHTITPAAGREWRLFDGSVGSFPTNLALNDVVKSQVSVVVSGGVTFVPAGA